MQHAVPQAEYRRIGSYAERQRQDGDGRETGLRSQQVHVDGRPNSGNAREYVGDVIKTSQRRTHCADGGPTRSRNATCTEW
jgi:hypothetical protein